MKREAAEGQWGFNVDEARERVEGTTKGRALEHRGRVTDTGAL